MASAPALAVAVVLAVLVGAGALQGLALGTAAWPPLASDQGDRGGDEVRIARRHVVARQPVDLVGLDAQVLQG